MRTLVMPVVDLELAPYGDIWEGHVITPDDGTASIVVHPGSDRLPRELQLTLNIAGKQRLLGSVPINPVFTGTTIFDGALYNFRFQDGSQRIHLWHVAVA